MEDPVFHVSFTRLRYPPTTEHPEVLTVEVPLPCRSPFRSVAEADRYATNLARAVQHRTLLSRHQPVHQYHDALHFTSAPSRPLLPPHEGCLTSSSLFDEKWTSIGRDPKCGLMLSRELHYASHQHALLVLLELEEEEEEENFAADGRRDNPAVAESQKEEGNQEEESENPSLKKLKRAPPISKKKAQKGRKRARVAASLEAEEVHLSPPPPSLTAERTKSSAWRWYLVDCQSSNGTLLDHRRLHWWQPTLIRPGQRVIFGGSRAVACGEWLSAEQAGFPEIVEWRFDASLSRKNDSRRDQNVSLPLYPQPQWLNVESCATTGTTLGATPSALRLTSATVQPVVPTSENAMMSRSARNCPLPTISIGEPFGEISSGDRTDGPDGSALLSDLLASASPTIRTHLLQGLGLPCDADVAPTVESGRQTTSTEGQQLFQRSESKSESIHRSLRSAARGPEPDLFSSCVPTPSSLAGDRLPGGELALVDDGPEWAPSRLKEAISGSARALPSSRSYRNPSSPPTTTSSGGPLLEAASPQVQRPVISSLSSHSSQPPNPRKKNAPASNSLLKVGNEKDLTGIITGPSALALQPPSPQPFVACRIGSCSWRHSGPLPGIGVSSTGSTNSKGVPLIPPWTLHCTESYIQWRLPKSSSSPGSSSSFSLSGKGVLMIPVPNIEGFQVSTTCLCVRLKPHAQIPLVPPSLFGSVGGKGELGSSSELQKGNPNNIVPQQHWVTFEFGPDEAGLNPAGRIAEQWERYYGRIGLGCLMTPTTSMGSTELACKCPY